MIPAQWFRSADCYHYRRVENGRATHQYVMNDGFSTYTHDHQLWRREIPDDRIINIPTDTLDLIEENEFPLELELWRWADPEGEWTTDLASTYPVNN